ISNVGCASTHSAWRIARHNKSSISRAEHTSNADLNCVISNNLARLGVKFINLNAVPSSWLQARKDRSTPKPDASRELTPAKSSTAFRMRGCVRTAFCNCSAWPNVSPPAQRKTVTSPKPWIVNLSIVAPQTGQFLLNRRPPTVLTCEQVEIRHSGGI